MLAEEELRKSSIIINSTTDAVVTTDLNGIVTSWNRGAELIYKYKPDEIIGKSVNLLWRKKDFPILESIIADLIAGKEIANYDGVCLDKKGNEISVLLALTSIKDKTGNNTELVGITKDISDRKRAEDALRSSGERFRDLAEMLPEAVFETDRNLNLTFANRRAFELFGYSDEDLEKGLNGLDMLVPENRERAKINMVKRLRGEDPRTAEYQALRKDGTTFPVLFHASSIAKDGELIGLRGIIVDITERKKVEENLHYRLEMEELIMKISSYRILENSWKPIVVMYFNTRITAE
jgi:PAS domain S-box-containing protein